jgi:trigger factor
MSLINSTKLDEANKYELEVKVEKETFAAATIKAYKKQVKNINIPGFRKGKAPKHIIERMYGKGVFYDDAIEDTYPSALADATVEAELKPVSVDDLSVGEVSEDGYTFKAKVTVAPELTVDGYKGIEVEKLSTEVTDELVDEELQAVRERNGRMVTVEDRAAENGDTTVIDFEGFVDGEAFEGGKSENYNLRLGDGNFIPGFEEAIVGHKTGEEFTIDVTFPEDYNAENLAGKEAQFKIKLHEIKTKELPEVDDEFVKDVSEKDTLDEYKEELKEKVAKRLEEQAEKDIIIMAAVNNEPNLKMFKVVSFQLDIYNLYINYTGGISRPYNTNYLIRSDFPVISAGCSTPMISSIVGARSASTPPSASFPSTPTAISGTGLVV